MRLSFKGVEEERIQNCFKKVFKTYERLHTYDIVLEQNRVKGSTMQAQPIIGFNSLFNGVRKYKVKLGVYIKDSETARVADLPSDVLEGWFAHELGHLIDYEAYNNWQMIVYGLKYISSERFKKEVEHKADLYAIEHGFGQQIVAAKKFILGSPLFKEDYKNIIKKYYMPLQQVEERINSL